MTNNKSPLTTSAVLETDLRQRSTDLATQPVPRPRIDPGIAVRGDVALERLTDGDGRKGGRGRLGLTGGRPKEPRAPDEGGQDPCDGSNAERQAERRSDDAPA